MKLEDRIIEQVALTHDVSVGAMRGSRGSRSVIIARHAAMCLLREMTNLSHEKIARLLNRDCHTTVTAGIRSHLKRIRSSPVVRDLDLHARAALAGALPNKSPNKPAIGRPIKSAQRETAE